jgi:hypothetical protein
MDDAKVSPDMPHKKFPSTVLWDGRFWIMVPSKFKPRAMMTLSTARPLEYKK